MEYKALQGALKKASKSPQINESNEDTITKLYGQQLRKVIRIIQAAQESLNAGFINKEQFARFLSSADEEITRLCKEQYDGEYTDDINSFDVDALDSNEVINMEKYPYAGGNDCSFDALLAFLTRGSDTSPAELEEFWQTMRPPPWPTTPRPSPDHSSLLSRFSSKYSSETVERLISTAPVAKVDILRSVLEAHMEIRSYRICNPTAMALNSNYLALACAGGWKERECIFYRYIIPGSDENNEHQGSTKELDEESDILGFYEPAQRLLYHSQHLWAQGDCRIKGYDAETNDLKYTLRGVEYGQNGAFGVTDDLVFQMGKSGKIFSWKMTKLQEHEPVMFDSPEDEKPLGGRIYSEDWWLDEDAQEKVEMSRGQKPDSSTSIKGLGLVNVISPLPYSTKYLCSSTGYPEDKNTYAVKVFDLGQVGADADVVGIGMAAGVEDFATHVDLPNIYVAAGGDHLARIFDIRYPIAQIFLDGHMTDIDCCTIGSSHSEVPLVFTAGRDEVIKAWDIRHSKACLYELSTGTLRATSLAFHDERSTLFAACMNENADRLGYHHDYDEFDDIDEEEDGYDEDATHWPKQSNTAPEQFGQRWCQVDHCVLEYRFKHGAEKTFFPASESPSSPEW
ncbi:hypothetical protein FRC02_004154 [Tulasnella sp. 418]|nr:hypothetical protein FRC02_004154 [Tulasnella sp. 418]